MVFNRERAYESGNNNARRYLSENPRTSQEDFDQEAEASASRGFMGECENKQAYVEGWKESKKNAKS
jgi:hypothetical protein